MVLRLLLGCSMMVSIYCHSQNLFGLNSRAGDSIWVQINQDTLIIGHENKKVGTKYPRFDTLTFLGNGDRRPVICNFKPDSIYSITHACCATLDIIPTSKLDHDSLAFWDFEKDHSKIQNQLLDRPFFSMKLSESTSDTIYGWYADYACMPKFKRLSEKTWNYGTPIKCFYWSNISPFVFFKSKEDYTERLNDQSVIEDDYPDWEEIEVLGEINLRLFDDHKFVLTYDVLSKKVILEYQKS